MIRFIMWMYFQKSNPSFSYEVIIVDDGSKDKTTQVKKNQLLQLHSSS